jgi:hypothetical protein
MSFLGVSPVDAHEKTGDTFLGAANTLLLLPTFSLLSGSKESPFTLAIYTGVNDVNVVSMIHGLLDRWPGSRFFGSLFMSVDWQQSQSYSVDA